jgi:nucleoredoxin
MVLLESILSCHTACRRFTPLLIELYKNLKARDDTAVEDFEIVFCSMDRTEDEYKTYASEMPWWCLPHKSPQLDRLASQYGAEGIPHLVILDKNGNVIVPDGVGQVSIDQQGEDFPWRPKPIVELLPTHYIGTDKKTRHSISDLDDKYLLLYFSAHWCPPCKGFTPKLSKAYTALKENRDDFEVRCLQWIVHWSLSLAHKVGSHIHADALPLFFFLSTF